MGKIRQHGVWLLSLMILMACNTSPVEGFKSPQNTQRIFHPIRDSQTGRVFAYKVISPTNTQKLQSVKPAVASQIAHDFILNNKDFLGLNDASTTLDEQGSGSDDISHRSRFFQKYKGIPVYGTDLSIHMNPAGEISYIKRKLVDEFPTSIPSISERDARALALELAQNQFPRNELDILETELMFLPVGFIRNTPEVDTHLTWQVTVVDKVSQGARLYANTFFLDAQKGEDLLELSGHMKLFREIYDCAGEPDIYNLRPLEPFFSIQMNGNSYGGAGTPCNHNLYPLLACAENDTVSPVFPPYVFGRSEGKPPRGSYPVPGPVATVPTPSPIKPPAYTPTPVETPIPFYPRNDVDNFYDIFADLDSYISTHFSLFNGPNKNGGTGLGILNSAVTRGWAFADTCTTDVCPGSGFYSRTGDGSIFLCVGTVIPDMAGHEYYHAVIQNSGVKNFTYTGQPGALQEGSADFMGEAFELYKTGTTDWKNRTTPMFPPIRDIANPKSIINPFYLPYQPFPDHHYSPGFYCGSFDSSGIHDNSTVISHALYLIAMGGELNGCDIEPQGVDVAQQILYRGWNSKFSRSVGFFEAYTDLYIACTEIYTTSVCDHVRNALQAAELNQPGKCTATPEVAPACAKKHAGPIVGTRTNHVDTSVFTFGENILVHGTQATLGRKVDVRIAPHVNSRAEWSSLAAIPATPYTFESTEFFFGPVTTANQAGKFDIIIDGNKDGFYQSWADSVAVVEVKGNVDGDGICYQGDSPQTSENCHSAPNDCGCASGFSCQDMSCPGEISGLPFNYLCIKDELITSHRPKRCI